jgi:hypothetical protein
MDSWGRERSCDWHLVVCLNCQRVGVWGVGLGIHVTDSSIHSVILSDRPPEVSDRRMPWANQLLKWKYIMPASPPAALNRVRAQWAR